MERHQKPLPAREPDQAGRSGPRCHPAAALQGPNGAGFVEEIRHFMLFRGSGVPKAGGGGGGSVFDPSRGHRERPFGHTEPRAERHRVPLSADIERGIRPATGYRACQGAGQSIGRVHARREASGPGALGRGPMCDGEPLVRLRVTPHGVRRLHGWGVDSEQD